MRIQIGRPALALAFVSLLQACAALPGSGPGTDAVERYAAPADAAASPVQLVDINEDVSQRLAERRRLRSFTEVFGDGVVQGIPIGAGDTLEIAIWEAPPAALFGTVVVDPRLLSTSQANTLPEQVVDVDGFIDIPFVGRVRAAGRSAHEVGEEIAQKLKGKANHPQVLVRVARNASSSVAVVGEVNSSLRVPLTSSGERLLDALALAGGARQPIGKTSIQLTRGAQVYAVPLDVVIRDPRQNIVLRPGDVVTALFQPFSFTALGATGKNDEINFEAAGINLAQAVARAGGLGDFRAAPQGVFIFRFEAADALQWRQPVRVAPNGTVPVVYRIDLRDPGSLFAMQSFPMQDRDVVFVSNSVATEFNKFLSLVLPAYYPLRAMWN